MFKLCRQLLFRSSNWKQQKTTYFRQILVQDRPFRFSLTPDIPEQCLDTEVSDRLNIKYLSKCEQSEEEIKNKLEYKGAIIGVNHSLFVSIPVMLPEINKYVNVHFLVDTGSHITALTHRALCAINQKPFSTDYQFTRQLYRIGGRVVQIHFPKQNPSHLYSNLNVLGMNFFTKYTGFKLNINTKGMKFDLRLDK